MIPSSLLNWLHRELESAVSSSLEGVVFWVVRKFVDLTVVDSESGSNLKVILIADRDIASPRLSVTRDDDKAKGTRKCERVIWEKRFPSV